MDHFLFTDILDNTLVPFVTSTYPDPPRFMQDNDPKHASHYARDFLVNKGINWWKTPAESPDLNPIENLWHEMKEFVRREVKPKTKQELIGTKHALKDITNAQRIVENERSCLQKKVKKVTKLYEDTLADLFEMEDDLFIKNSELLETISSLQKEVLKPTTI